ncbi:MAG TPA: hypothetical protein VNW15_04140 [Rhizomicrobium sp.]|jgi:hypothetical protein|nr:hypothetical protein [Rhizomicrobium sp.]
MGDVDFQGRLMPGERIVWTGQPRSGLRLTGQDLILVPFSLMWGGFAIFWEWGVTQAPNTPTFFSLWGVPFVLVGLYMIAGRFFVDSWLRGHTLYAVTNQRVLILRTVPTTRFTALAIDRLPELSLYESNDGTGTIRFQQTMSPFYGRGFGGWNPALDPTPQFLAVPDARSVFAQIQKLSIRP